MSEHNVEELMVRLTFLRSQFNEAIRNPREFVHSKEIFLRISEVVKELEILTAQGSDQIQGFIKDHKVQR